MPSMAGKTAWAANGATFKGEWASGFAVAHRLDTPIPVAVTAGYSYGEAAGHGVRMGLAGEF
jgi:trimeric autotransporter adhesin